MRIGFASAGSQRWLNRKPELLLGALRRSGALEQRTSMTWYSPLEKDCFREYRDISALTKAALPTSGSPWFRFARRGPVWDAIGITSDGAPLFIEAKAHIPKPRHRRQKHHPSPEVD